MTARVTGDNAVLETRSAVTATIHGAHATWNLALTTHYTLREGRWIAMRTVAATF